MFAVMVNVHIKPEYRKEFVEAMLDDARGSVRNESACLLFNVVQDSEDENCLHLYEVYASAEAFEEHKKTPHFIRWVEITKNWLASPLEIFTGVHLFPADGVWKKQA